ncbi:hypothetical protein QP932_09020 [Corynebacterium freneyi]|uniref:hypothetical protein n=1 Tax=Corynebacterium freneyi TaxID=134034 RepID=UPI00254C412B|nr:hypothetical protein [Corynebacterium freneyi]MDK8768634.1 hypothetical protein [Corynebacterium freneyi]
MIATMAKAYPHVARRLSRRPSSEASRFSGPGTGADETPLVEAVLVDAAPAEAVLAGADPDEAPLVDAVSLGDAARPEEGVVVDEGTVADEVLVEEVVVMIVLLKSWRGFR